MIGATDSHTGLATAEEENFFGKHSGAEPSAERWEAPDGEGRATDAVRELGAWWPRGYAGVWASREHARGLFDAMMRKETYATTGRA